jgi:GAF domain-containing protein
MVALQTMADQVAGSIENARLYGESQALLAAARRASGELSIASWAQVLNARSDLGFRSTEAGVERTGRSRAAASPGTVPAQGRARGTQLAVPIRMYGQVIGTLRLVKPDGAGPWEREQVALVEQIVSELSQALENARLYEETQRRGLREQQLRQIGTRMQSTVDLDAILQGAVADMARALGVSSAFVQLYEGGAASGGETADGVRNAGQTEARDGGAGQR